MRRLLGKITLRGTGLHTGLETELSIEPCDSPHIMMSLRGEEMPLHMLKCEGVRRSSDYVFPSGQVLRTCEHVLSALCGTGIYSGVRVSADGGEMPALDGCAKTLCAEILSHSVIDGKDIPRVKISSPVIVSNDDMTRFVCAFPADEFHITYAAEYDTVGTQIYDFRGSDDYAADIAPARTFAYEREIEYLRSHGMALGGSLDNAVLIGEDRIIASGGLRWPDEFVRHKILDLIGDLASVGFPLNAHIIAVRAGHELHLKLADKLKGEMNIGRD